MYMANVYIITLKDHVGEIIALVCTCRLARMLLMKELRIFLILELLTQVKYDLVHKIEIDIGVGKLYEERLRSVVCW